MKKQFLAKHKGVAMAIAVGAAAMTAPMTTHAEELAAAEPVEPVTSTDSVAPATPAEPAAPVTPAEPAAPAAPASLADSGTPEPADSGTPAPAEPSTPEPADPDAPTNPADPDTPTNPADPDIPTNPADPDTPTNPADPGTPTNPADPETPTDPADTDTSDPADSDTSSSKPETLEEAEKNLEQAKREEEAAQAKKEAAEVKEQEAADAEQEAQEDVDNANQDVQDITNALINEEKTANDNVEDAQQTVTNAETSDESNKAMADLTNSQQQMADTKDKLTGIIEGTITEVNTDDEKKAAAEEKADKLIAAQEAVKTAEEKAKEAEAALGDTTSQEDSAKVNAEKAKDEMDESEKALAGLKKDLEELEKKVSAAQTALKTAISDATAVTETSTETKQALADLNNLLEQYTTAQNALTKALATQTDVTSAQQALRDAQTALKNLSDAQESYATALKNRNDKQTYLDNIQKTSIEVSTALAKLGELVNAQADIKSICDKMQDLTPDKEQNLASLKAKLEEAAKNATDKQEEYQNAVTTIDNYLKAVHDLDVPTTELLDATWLTGDSDTGAATAVAEKTKLLNTLSEALTGNLSDSTKKELNTAETALNTAKNKLLTAVESIVKATAALSDGTELSAPKTTTVALSNAATNLTKKAEAYKNPADDTEINLKDSLTSAAEKLAEASSALATFATAVNKGADGTLTIDQSIIDNANTAINNALKELITKQDDQTQGIADANVAAKQDAVTDAQNKLKEKIDSVCADTSALSKDHKTAISGAYNGLVSAQNDLTTKKPDFQSQIAEANKIYLDKTAAYKTAYEQLTWLQKDLEDANANVTKTQNDYQDRLKQIAAPGIVQDTDLSQDQQDLIFALKKAVDNYETAQQDWTLARQNIETTRQSIKDAKENLSAKKTELTKAIAKKTLAETILVRKEQASSVEAKIQELGFRLSDFNNEILNYETARDAVTKAETALTTKENEHAEAVDKLNKAKEQYERASNNLAIAQGYYDALKPKPPVPSTPLASHVQSSRVNTPPSYEAAYEAVSVSADAGHEDDSAYTYSGFLQECEKSILTLKPMNRTSPNLQLTVNNSGLTIKTKTWMSFDRKVIEALSKRPDLALDLSFFYKGQWYRAIIPAGYDLTSLLNEEGYCGFLYIYSLFGVVWQTPAV